MSEIRLAKEGETSRQKEIWKQCFGDSDSYIDFYYSNRYRVEETLILLHNGEISAMLTMIPVRTIQPEKLSIDTVMLYAIATDPKYQNRGFATQLIDFSNQYLRANNKNLSVLVPANQQLFDYYRKQGYQDGFYIRETLLTQEKIYNLPIIESFHCTISAITPEEYNHRRNNQLNGWLYIAYDDKDVAYQKMLSQASGADIYGIESEEIQGCVAIERLNYDKVLIKEILVPEKHIDEVLKQISKQVHAKEYILRTPAYLYSHLGGDIRPFGMIRGQRETESKITPETLGYLGFAFD